MNRVIAWAATAAISGMVLPVAAQQTAGQATGGQAETVEIQIMEAERALEEAAQQIAALSAQELARAGEFEQYATRVDRVMLGINIAAESESGAVAGVRVEGITPGGAADDAGLRSGDILTAVNGEVLSGDNSLEASHKLLDFMVGVEEGDVLEIDYLRAGSAGKVSVEPRRSSHMPFTMTLNGSRMMVPGAPRPPNAPQVMAFRWMQQGGKGLGDMEMVELTEKLGRYFGTDSGLLIVRAPANNAFGLEDGDVIKSIDGREPRDLFHAVRILSSYENGETVNIDILRDQQPRTLSVEVPDDRTSYVLPPKPPRPVAPPAPGA